MTTHNLRTPRKVAQRSRMKREKALGTRAWSPWPRLRRLPPRAGLVAMRLARGGRYLWLSLAATLLACGMHTFAFAPAVALDGFGIDSAFHLRGARSPAEVSEKLPQSRDIITVELPPDLPRPMLAKLLQKLRLARAIGVDLMLLDHEALLNASDIAPLQKRAWFGREIANWRHDDAILAAQLRRMPQVVIGTWPEQERAADPQAPARSMFATVWRRPDDALWNATRQHAHLTVLGSEGGTVRAVRLWETTKTGPQPCMALALAALAQNTTPRRLTQSRKMSPDGAMLVDFLGGRECFDYATNRVVYQRVLDDWSEPNDFKGKIVLLGDTSLVSKEIKETPFGPMPGMHVHAMAVATLLSVGGAPRLLSLPMCALLTIACCGLLILPMAWWPAWSSWMMGGAQSIGLLLLGGWLLERGLVLPLSVPVIAIILTLNAVTVVEYRRARHTLGRFIGSEMPRALRTFGPGPQLGGRVAVATAFFCDLRGYSELAATLPLPTLAALMNAYTATIVGVVRGHGGRPIDFQGDGMFVLFESDARFGPNGERDCARRAVRAAIETQQAFARSRPHFAALGAHRFEAAIGVATGPMLIGMVGGQEHLKPGAVGETVNVAARLQTLSEACNCNILLTPTTRDLLDESFAAIPCGEHFIKGCTNLIQIWGVSMSKSAHDANEDVGNDNDSNNDYAASSQAIQNLQNTMPGFDGLELHAVAAPSSASLRLERAFRSRFDVNCKLKS